MRRVATLVSLTVFWVVVGAPQALAASRLDQPALEGLRDLVVAAAPAGSAAYVDAETGQVVLRVPAARTERVAAVIGRHGRQVRVQEHSTAAVQMDGVFGGTRMETAFNERDCTTGFVASGGGWLWMTTAGHCVQDGTGNTAYWYTPGGYNNGGLIGVGTILDPVVQGRDFGVIQISRISPHTYGPYVWQDGELIHITRASMPSKGKGSYLGTPICKTGQITGTTCGNVTNTNVSVNFHTGVVGNLIETTACARPGDSGSPLFSQNPVIVRGPDGEWQFHRDGYGVLVGGNVWGCGDPAFRSYYQPLVEVLDHYGLTLLT